MRNLTEDEVLVATSSEGCITTVPLINMADLEWVIGRMHEMYSLPVKTHPSLEHERTEAFTRVLQKEVDESKEVNEAVWAWKGRVSALDDLAFSHGVNSPEYVKGQKDVKDTYLDALAAQADWLNDIIVYCLSEQMKMGLSPAICLAIIMNSNFTKLGADYKPILDEDGKVCKGPNFKKPEPTLRAVIEAALNKHFQQQGA